MSEQWTEAQLKAATPEQVAAAFDAGQLHAILTGTTEQGAPPHAQN